MLHIFNSVARTTEKTSMKIVGKYNFYDVSVHKDKIFKKSSHGGLNRGVKNYWSTYLISEAVLNIVKFQNINIFINYVNTN